MFVWKTIRGSRRIYTPDCHLGRPIDSFRTQKRVRLLGWTSTMCLSLLDIHDRRLHVTEAPTGQIQYSVHQGCLGHIFLSWPQEMRLWGHSGGHGIGHPPWSLHQPLPSGQHTVEAGLGYPTGDLLHPLLRIDIRKGMATRLWKLLVHIFNLDSIGPKISLRRIVHQHLIQSCFDWIIQAQS